MPASIVTETLQPPKYCFLSRKILSFCQRNVSLEHFLAVGCLLDLSGDCPPAISKIANMPDQQATMRDPTVILLNRAL